MRLLDLFSGAGGSATGYARAGFEVVGVDHVMQPRYPFEHYVADALEFLAAHGREYDAIHASPPCHDHSTLASMTGMDGTGELLDQTRQALREWAARTSSRTSAAPTCPEHSCCAAPSSACPS